MRHYYEIPNVIYSRDGKTKGEPTGGSRPCQLEGCGGMRIATRWPDGSLTWPCNEGLTTFKDGEKIL